MMSRIPLLLALCVAVAACGTSPDRSTPPDCNEAVRTYARLCERNVTNEDVAWQRLKYEGCTSYSSYTPDSEAQYAAFDKSKAWVDCVLATTTCEAAEACPTWAD